MISAFWIGAMLGLFAGTAIGVFLTCLMVAAQREPEADPITRLLALPPEMLEAPLNAKSGDPIRLKYEALRARYDGKARP